MAATRLSRSVLLCALPKMAIPGLYSNPLTNTLWEIARHATAQYSYK